MLDVLRYSEFYQCVDARLELKKRVMQRSFAWSVLQFYLLPRGAKLMGLLGGANEAVIRMLISIGKSDQPSLSTRE